jgi:hypothetical protein
MFRVEYTTATEDEVWIPPGPPISEHRRYASISVHEPGTSGQHNIRTVTGHINNYQTGSSPDPYSGQEDNFQFRVAPAAVHHKINVLSPEYYAKAPADS